MSNLKAIKVIVGRGLKKKIEADAWLINDPEYFDGNEAICIVFTDGGKEYQVAVQIPR
jgi:hypothetical protein